MRIGSKWPPDDRRYYLTTFNYIWPPNSDIHPLLNLMQLRRVATLLPKTSLHQQRCCRQHSTPSSFFLSLGVWLEGSPQWIRKLLVSKLVVLVGSQEEFCNHFASWRVLLLPPGSVWSAPAPPACLSSTTMTSWKKKAEPCRKSFATKNKGIGEAFGTMIGGRVWMITGSLFMAPCTATCGPTDLKRLHWSSRTTPSRSILANPYLPFRLGKFFSTTWKVTKTLCGLTLNFLFSSSSHFLTSKLRAKRSTYTFWVDKRQLKML